MRQLATIRKIAALDPIEGADAIVVATINGWKVVVRLNEFKVGDLCIYCEVDSFLPDGDIRWQHLVDKHGRIFEGAKGHRLRTVKLRGQISQGFATPAPASSILLEGIDVSVLLGIKKWEAPVPAELSGQLKGNFPSFIPKTDQERCQNIGDEIFLGNYTSQYEVTMKMDGTSFTGYHYNDVTGCCGRNWELKVDDSNASNSLVRMFVDSKLQQILHSLRLNYAVQGELMGPSIQKNREEFKAHKLFIFDVYDIDAGKYLTPAERQALMAELYVFGLNKDMVEHVPIIAYSACLYDTLGIKTLDRLLAFAEGASINHPVREGLVFKRIDGQFSFKAISNHFLLKEKD